jgi:hypothetical protein
MKASEIEGVAVVMHGAFNPSIFQPRWLATQHLIRAEEAERSKISVIQSEVADFATEWFQLQVLQDRLQLISNDARQYGPLRDLAVSICVLLPHTPVKTVALSRHFHFKSESAEAWHAVGHRLAPKQVWNEFFKDPGLRSMTMQGVVDQKSRGVAFIKVEPSVKVQPGIFLEVSEQFKTAEQQEDKPSGAHWVPEILTERWDIVMNFAETVAAKLLRTDATT